LISNLTVEAIVFDKPKMKLAPNGQEFLSMQIGLFNIKENSGAQEFTYVECTLWSNPNLAKRIIEMDVEPRDRVLVNGKLNLSKYRGRPKMRLYIYDFTLLSRATYSTKNVEHEMENIDYSIFNDKVEVFDTTPVVIETPEEFIEDKIEKTVTSEEF
jgi:hypothetical protein